MKKLVLIAVAFGFIVFSGGTALAGDCSNFYDCPCGYTQYSDGSCACKDCPHLFTDREIKKYELKGYGEDDSPKDEAVYGGQRSPYPVQSGKK
jgi:hypothetical protein